MERIARVEALRFPMGSSWLVDTLIANPMSIYPRYREKRSSWMRAMTTVIIRVSSESGLSGLGWVGGGKAAPASLVEDVFADLVVGESPFDTEALWDRMYRASIPYGRKGAAVEAISGIDTALWDLVGRITGQPVYRLLGGKTKDTLPVYATGNAVESHVARGFRDVKLAMIHGPADGRAGMDANEDLVRTTRESIGPDGQIMLDCYMGWDEPYTIEMAARLRQYRVRWIEEPLMPQYADGHRRLRDLLNPMGILVTGGEHEFTRWGFRQLIEKQAVDILQPDIGRAGGISGGQEDLRAGLGLRGACHPAWLGGADLPPGDEHGELPVRRVHRHARRRRDPVLLGRAAAAGRPHRAHGRPGLRVRAEP